MVRYIKKFFRILMNVSVETAASIFAILIGVFGNLSDPIYAPILLAFSMPTMKTVLVVVGSSLLFSRVVNGEGLLWTGFARAVLCAVLAVVFFFMGYGAGHVISGSPAHIGYLLVGFFLVINGLRNAFEWSEFIHACRVARNECE